MALRTPTSANTRELWHGHPQTGVCTCACVRACAGMRVCVRACVYVCVCVCASSGNCFIVKKSINLTETDVDVMLVLGLRIVNSTVEY